MRRHQSREALDVVPQLLELAVGEPRPSALETAVPHSRFVWIGEHHQLLGLAHRGQCGMQYAIPQAEYGGVGSDAEGQREDGDRREPGSRRQGASRVAQVLQEIGEHVSAGDSRCDRRWLMREAKRRDGAGQRVPVPEFGQRQLRGLVGQRTACHQLAPAVVEMLRELVDDVGLARGRESERR